MVVTLVTASDFGSEASVSPQTSMQVAIIEPAGFNAKIGFQKEFLEGPANPAPAEPTLC